jgi:endonuclease YncB( thermonuclease family)
MDSRSFHERKSVPGYAAMLAGVVLFAAEPAYAAKSFRGPVEATVVEVIDGDTFLAEAHIWPGQSVRVNIRVRGIDAPEMKSRCESERVAALHARAVLAELIGGGAISIQYRRREILRPRAGRRRHARGRSRIENHDRAEHRAPIRGWKTAELVRLNQYGTGQLCH